MTTYFPCSYLYANFKSFNNNIEALLNQITGKDRVTSLVFFGSSSDENYEKELAVLTTIVPGHFKTQIPLVSYVSQSLPDSKMMAVEVHCLPDGVPSESLIFKQQEGLRYAIFELKSTKTLVIEGAMASSFSLSYTRQGDEIFEKIGAVLSSESMHIHEIVRQWNYIGNITQVQNGIQNYQAFNDARARFYEKTDWKNCGYPAATGIGADVSGISVSLIAISGLRSIPVDNPLQIAAHSYSQSLLVGGDKRTPKFERARLIKNGFGSNCFVSGTAAIRGEESMKVLNAGLQTRQTIENINYLLSAENLKRYGLNNGARLEMTGLRIYVKKMEYLDSVKSEIEKTWPGLPAIYLQADICREELLVEIEGTAMDAQNKL
ncbi:MAG: hypothetical protein A2W90_05060 [Bacteroidetes bacterium GWF2_42_66]|nr:MAG: hypothetical protein A2W92_03235 [Bacteroidetes bacterium GWA2_42_15]OFX95953.1 MAG: hypothetical protein A2W89_02470 [Bacteroidetes bacterium GWE2_42_39]OFY46526.1 MAG: hypothetical protein A2W90_05060 [Bacteroidetes bacterium GWF2_42_66]HBL75621.1 hypothetical protein [Prolixibacteraceae bacterium]HCR89043.1 hypothetical protein [Prolixibacteraceae bacterium]